ncbi:hypothetical protein B0T10DRAFT_481723 [Thelonectria olida]|uniref:U4/U6.U5 small nuclear ribonucleoprotein 27kDa protein domain-containing protein n=1 Tax=Thelonectria olida TaxID=1576542 RepID=A0A9P8W8L5_9HYPO|nr:hypothetical protein B0T10DRAFT_481723 [Thelonectria olida]
MGDSRRRNRPDSRQMWDDSDNRRDRRRDRPDRDRDRDQDRRGYRSRSRDRQRGGDRRDRSRSPDRRHRNRDGDRHRHRDRRDGPRNYDHKDHRDSRRDEDDAPRNRRDYDGPDRRANNRRSASPPIRSRSPSNPTLPTRSKPDGRADGSKKPGPHMSVNVASNDGRSPHREDEDADIKDAGEASDEDEPAVDDDMAAMQAMMGFGGFGTTKNKKIAGNNVGAVRKEKKSEYRQYMNRQGGFNRPLSPSR